MSICSRHPEATTAVAASHGDEAMVRVEYCPCEGRRTDAEILAAAPPIPGLRIEEWGMDGGTPAGPGVLYAVLRARMATQ